MIRVSLELAILSSISTSASCATAVRFANVVLLQKKEKTFSATRTARIRLAVVEIVSISINSNNIVHILILDLSNEKVLRWYEAMREEGEEGEVVVEPAEAAEMFSMRYTKVTRDSRTCVCITFLNKGIKQKVNEFRIYLQINLMSTISISILCFSASLITYFSFHSRLIYLSLLLFLYQIVSFLSNPCTSSNLTCLLRAVLFGEVIPRYHQTNK